LGLLPLPGVPVHASPQKARGRHRRLISPHTPTTLFADSYWQSRAQGGPYNSIDHERLFDLACAAIDDEHVPVLIRRYIHRTVYDDGRYREVQRGICPSCPLSPLMRALYLWALDARLEVLGKTLRQVFISRASRGFP
jgi:hypothetical protein